MKITLVPSAHAGTGTLPSQFLTSFIVNDHVAIDVGSLGFYREPEQQAAIRHVFLSHTHIDHLASLPIFLENVAGMSTAPVTLHTSETVQESLRQDLFNGRLWADFLNLKFDGKPFVVIETIQGGQPVEVEGLRITPVAVDHTVPTLGFIIEDKTAAVVIPSDTGPTEEIWARARQTPNVKAVFLEATFPDNMTDLAKITGHLTPADFAREMQKLPGAATFYAVHIKARFRERVAQELKTHEFARLKVAEFGTTYEF